MVNKKWRKLTPEETRVIRDKGTEPPFRGEYTDTEAKGLYVCRRCSAPLYLSKDKFQSHCGWPAFDDEIEWAIRRKPDADGRRIEILCENCGGHLGHVFEGEGLTAKNVRHCVNSISMKFIPEVQEGETHKAIFAGGCFWGVQHWFDKQEGVLKTSVGYTGGHVVNPTYEQVCAKTTGHVEAIEVTYDPTVISYEKLVQLFFEIHDPTQADGQGPDKGEQYLSAVFYADNDQRKIALRTMDFLRHEKKMEIATTLHPAEKFWAAEDYHQSYYEKTGKEPYCHVYKKIF